MLFALEEIMKTEMFWAPALGATVLILILAIIALNLKFNPPTNQKEEKVKPKTIIVFCSDPRFQAEFAKFVRKRLGLGDGEFVPILTAGGPAAFANTAKRCYDFKFLKGQIEFFSEHFPSIEEIVLVGHQDCGYYNEILELPGQEKEDLIQARRTLGTFWVKSVWLYYAKFSSDDQTQIIFDQVLAPSAAQVSMP